MSVPGPGTATQTAGIANIGIHQEVTLHQYAVPGTTPAAPTVTWDDTGFLGSTGSWWPTATGALGAAAPVGPLFIGLPRARAIVRLRAAIPISPGTCSRRSMFSILSTGQPTGINSTTPMTSGPEPDGRTAATRRLGPSRTSPPTEIEIWDGSLYHSSGFVSTDVRLFEADWNVNIARFSKLRFEVYTFDDFQVGTGARLAAGQRFETVLTPTRRRMAGCYGC